MKRYPRSIGTEFILWLDGIKRSFVINILLLLFSYLYYVDLSSCDCDTNVTLTLNCDLEILHLKSITTVVILFYYLRYTPNTVQ